MDAKSLRIGNLLLNFLGEVFEVNSATMLAFESNFHPFGKPSPTPIAEEWLLKLGLVNLGNHNINQYESEVRYVAKKFIEKSYDFEVCFATSTYGGEPYYSIRIRIDNEHVSLYCKLEFIHQLQNIFYALTGEELTLIEK